MTRIASLTAMVCLMLALLPFNAGAQVPEYLRLNGVDGPVSVMAGTLINLATEPGAGIYEYRTADCSGDVAVEHGSTAGVARGTATSVGFAPFRAGNIGACRVGTWTPRPTLTLNTVAANATVNIGESITFVTNPAVTIYRYANSDCSGSPTRNFPSGTAVAETTGITFSVLAAWSDVAVNSPCYIATWVDPAPAAPPPLTINGVAANATLTVGEVAIVQTDPAATISYFDSADCSGTPLNSVPLETAHSPTVASVISNRARWTASPDLQSACLVATWVAAPPVEPPPLTINGNPTSINLTVGQVAGFDTDPAATIFSYSSADCAGPVGSTWSPGFTSNPIAPVTYSAQAHWTAFPDILSPCLNATWTAAPPLPPPPLIINGVAADATLTTGDTATIETGFGSSILFYLAADCSGPSGTVSGSSATSMTTNEETFSYRAFWDAFPDVQSGCLNATWTAAASPSPSPSPTGTATATAGPTGVATAEPSAPASVRPTAATGVKPLPTSPARTTGAPVVTSLPSTGTGPTATYVVAGLTVVALIALIGAAGIRRNTDHR